EAAEAASLRAAPAEVAVPQAAPAGAAEAAAPRAAPAEAAEAAAPRAAPAEAAEAAAPRATPAEAAAPKGSVIAQAKTIAARDGLPLGCTLYLPAGREPERVVIVGCATAVRRGFYEPYARYLAANGCATLTFDYRGIGGSLRGPVARAAATIRDWGEKDYAAVVDAMASEFPGLTLQIVGHSVGGQLLGLLDNNHRIASAITVAAQHGYWRLYPAKSGLTYAGLWYGLMPGLARALSYFPAKKLKLGEDLPKGVALQWARWARSPHYMIDDAGVPLRQGFDKYEGPVRAYSFEDDERAPEACVRALHKYFKRTEVDFRHVRPAELGVKGIGHVGFFRAQFKHTLWKESLDWLRAH
ncbi:MAG TPA: alpha/beta fold hydrolase, partial [Polyangiaceae bacterium]|nr:alpha/beta fold hydrolase [Polyangiaceae bacterium]